MKKKGPFFAANSVGYDNRGPAIPAAINNVDCFSSEAGGKTVIKFPSPLLYLSYLEPAFRVTWGGTAFNHRPAAEGSRLSL